MLISVWMLSCIPAPNDEDIRLRAPRQTTLNAHQRKELIKNYRPILILFVVIYITLTMIRDIRDNFGVEIWVNWDLVKKYFHLYHHRDSCYYPYFVDFGIDVFDQR